MSPTLALQGGTHQGGPENIPLVGELAHSLRAQGQLAHREDVDTLIPEVSGPRGGRSGEGGHRQDLDNHGAYIPEVHDTLNAQYGKGIAGHNRERNVVALPQVAHALTSSPGVTEDGTGRGTPLVACPQPQSLAENQRGELFLSDVTNALTGGGGKPGQGYPAVACETQEELAYSLTNPGEGGRPTARGVLTPQMAVRRLLPVECCRLQGYPDDWLDGLGLSDSTKYRQLGNSVAVPVVRWIAERIVGAS